MQLIMYICLGFPTSTVAIVMLLKMYFIVLCAIVLPLKTFLHISIRLFINLPWIVQVNLDFH